MPCKHPHHDTVRPVKVDHLAFTFAYADLRHLDKSNDQDFINLQMPVYHEPKTKTKEQGAVCSTLEQIERHMEAHKKQSVKDALSSLRFVHVQNHGLSFIAYAWSWPSWLQRFYGHSRYDRTS